MARSPARKGASKPLKSKRSSPKKPTRPAAARPKAPASRAKAAPARGAAPRRPRAEASSPRFPDNPEVIDQSHRPLLPAETPGPDSRKGPVFPVEIDPRRIEASLAKVRDEVVHWAKKGRYTKVRFKFRNTQLLPDLPLATVVAAESLTFYWGGILRALMLNVAGQTFFNMELVNDSEKQVQKGKEALLTGDLELALTAFRKALDMERDNPRAHLSLGIALKLKGDPIAARASLETARSLDPEGAVGVEAEKVLASLGVARTSGAPGRATVEGAP